MAEKKIKITVEAEGEVRVYETIRAAIAEDKQVLLIGFENPGELIKMIAAVVDGAATLMEKSGVTSRSEARLYLMSHTVDLLQMVDLAEIREKQKNNNVAAEVVTSGGEASH